ncbi:MAG: hypothetical protein JXA09_12245 [Anaerolineae bacterium]|nr:hypothetical protein [Anaerolineae bacterium]
MHVLRVPIVLRILVSLLILSGLLWLVLSELATAAVPAQDVGRACLPTSDADPPSDVGPQVAPVGCQRTAVL